jgi:hypothetical protein
MSSSFFDYSNQSKFPDYSGVFNPEKAGQFGGLASKAFGADSVIGGGAKKFTVDKGIDFLSNFLESRGQNTYRKKFEEDEYNMPRSLGSVDTRGFGGSELFPGFSVYSAPPSHGIAYLPGAQGGGGFRGKGAAGGALSGAAAGAKLGSIIPGIGNIGGAIAGGLIGGISGGFG